MSACYTEGQDIIMLSHSHLSLEASQLFAAIPAELKATPVKFWGKASWSSPPTPLNGFLTPLTAFTFGEILYREKICKAHTSVYCYVHSWFMQECIQSLNISPLLTAWIVHMDKEWSNCVFWQRPSLSFASFTPWKLSKSLSSLFNWGLCTICSWAVHFTQKRWPILSKW